MRPRVPKKEKVFAVVPTLLTLGNAVCGFGSITFATKMGPGVTEGNDLLIAALLLLAAMVFDMLDGHAARLTKMTSEFGAQLDSLCDAISFGVAPAFIMLNFPQVHHLYHPRLLWVIAVLYVICAVMRLARFNVETGDEDSHGSFSGLPSPAAAGTVASVVIAMPGLEQLASSTTSGISQGIGHWLLSAAALGMPLVTLGLACLMVSRIRYPHVFNQLFRGRRDFRHLVQLIFAIVAVFAIHELAVPLVLFYFVLGSPIRALWTGVFSHWLAKYKGRSSPSQSEL